MKRSELISHCDQQVHPHMNFMFLEMEESRKKSNREIFELKRQLSDVYQHLKNLESSEKEERKKLCETVVTVDNQLTHTKNELLYTKERLATTLKDFKETKESTNYELALTKTKLDITLKDLKETKARLSATEFKLSRIEREILNIFIIAINKMT